MISVPPGTTHFAPMERGDLVAGLTLGFLEDSRPEAKRSERTV